MKELFKMFLTFFKIGSFTFGGGYAMIPLIEREVVDNNKWISKDEFIDIIAISQSFPGALAINSCTFIGYKIGGIAGGILGLLGVALPSFLIILLIALAFSKFRDMYIVELIFNGINAAVPLLILVGVNSLAQVLPKTATNIIIVIITVLLSVFLNVSPVYIILLSAVYGIFINRKEAEK
ncbi:chromate transporter [Clostridium culturomicium]|uniref:chromate transporter n=1 Tax=Clostridium culturomicium TaxID=1499683 RepID=UPI00058CE8FF|nr:chromate transporter [Clostridium culturomicium]